MKTVFICASAEPGRDGVGDYTRRLAAACAAAGHRILILALHDRHAESALTEEPQTGVTLHRWPSSQPWDERRAGVRACLLDFAPDWISWQMVAYGHHPKGILGPEMAALARDCSTIPTQVMLHELWIGMARGDSLWSRVTGWRQRRALLSFLRAAGTPFLYTSNQSYATALAAHGHPSLVMPVFSNIPITPASAGERAQALACHLPAATGSGGRLICATFGTLHPQWQPEATAHFLLATAARRQREAVVLAIGRPGPHGADILGRLTRAGVTTVATGELPPADVSRLLQAVDAGIAPHPWALVNKSGSVAAMLDHGLPVLLPRDDWHLRHARRIAPPADPRLARLIDLDTDSADAWLARRAAPRDTAAAIIGLFLYGFRLRP